MYNIIYIYNAYVGNLVQNRKHETMIIFWHNIALEANLTYSVLNNTTKSKKIIVYFLIIVSNKCFWGVLDWNTNTITADSGPHYVAYPKTVGIKLC